MRLIPKRLDNGLLSGIQSPLIIAGQGTDQLYLDDSGSTALISGTLSSTAVTGLGMGASGVQYAGASQLQVNLGAGNSGANNFNVVSTNGATATTVRRPASSNATNFYLGSKAPGTGGFVDNLQGALVIDGGGSDVLNVDDTGATRSKNGPLAGILTATTLSGLGFGSGVTYASFARINIFLGNRANVFTIQSTHAGTETHLTTDANDTVNVQSTASATFVTTLTGANTINVGSLAPNAGGVLDGIQGALTITGTGNDTLNLDDTGSAAGASKTGVLASTTVNGLNMGTVGGTNSVTYTGLANLNLSMGAAGYVFGITDTYVGSIGSTVTTINTGSGSNSINIGSTSRPTPAGPGNVAGIQGLLNINGGGFDTVTVDSTANNGPLTAYLTDLQLTGLGIGQAITFSGSGYSVGTSLFAAGDFAGLPSFANNFIANPNTELAPYQGASASAAIKFLAAEFQSLAPAQIAVMLNVYSTTRQLQNAFIAALNAVVLNPTSIYSAQVFSGVTLSGATQALMAQNPTQQAQVSRLNRLLLDDLFAQALPQPRARLMSLNINLSSAGNTFYAQGSAAWITNVSLGAGANALAIGTLAHATFNPATDLIAKIDSSGNPIPHAGTATDTGSVLDHLLGDLNVTGSGNDSLNIDDTGSVQGRHGVMDANSLAFDGLGVLTFSGFNFVVLSMGQGADQLQVQDTFARTDTIISTFVSSDFYADFPQLLLDLTTQTHPTGVSTFLWNQFTPATQSLLTSATATVAQKQQALADALNAIIQGGSSIYDATVFQGIQLSDATLTLIAETNLTAAQIVRLNRLLLEDAYPNLIARSAPTPVIYINGDGGDDVFAVFDTHCAVQINGGDGADTFYIFANSSPLALNGDDGDDSFYIFASIQTNVADASVDGGTGGSADLQLPHRMDTCRFDGGTGYNKLFVYGTILDDVITIDGNSITGAGLDIGFTNISELDIAGLQGSDTFYIKNIITKTRILGDANLPNFPQWIRIPPHFFDGKPVALIALPGSSATGAAQASASGVLSADFNYSLTVLDQSASISVKASATSGNTSATDLAAEILAAINSTVFAGEFNVYYDPVTNNIMLQLVGSQTENDKFFVGWRDVQIPFTSTDLPLPGSLSGIQASLSISAGAADGKGVKTIYIDDSGDTGNQTFTMTTAVDTLGVVNQVGAVIGQLNSSAMGPNGVIYWDNTADNINIQLGSGNNTFNINGNIAGAQTTIHGGSGNEHFIINAQDVSTGLGFLSPLQLSGNDNTLRRRHAGGECRCYRPEPCADRRFN